MGEGVESRERMSGALEVSRYLYRETKLMSVYGEDIL